MLSLALLLVAFQSKGAWPSNDKPLQTVMIVHSLKGTAVVKRGSKTFNISAFTAAARAKSGLRPIRLGIVDGDTFQLGPNSTASISGISDKGDIGEPRTAGRDYRVAKAYFKNHTGLTEPQYRQVRLLLCHSGNSKPLADRQLPQLVLPLQDDLVRAGAIPHHFHSVGQGKLRKAEVLYMLSRGELTLSSRTTPGARATIALDRTAVERQLTSHFGMDDGWSEKPIPVRVRLTDRVGRKYEVDVEIRTAADAAAVSRHLQALMAILREPAGDVRDMHLASLLSASPASRSELMFALARTPGSADSILRLMCEEAGLDWRLLTNASR